MDKDEICFDTDKIGHFTINSNDLSCEIQRSIKLICRCKFTAQFHASGKVILCLDMQLFDLEYYASLEDIKTWFFWGRVYYLLLCRPRRPSSCSQLHNYILFRQHRLNHINLGHATKKFSFSRQSCVIQNLPGWTGRKGQNRSTHNYTECLTCSIHQSMWCPKGGGGDGYSYKRHVSTAPPHPVIVIWPYWPGKFWCWYL